MAKTKTADNATETTEARATQDFVSEDSATETVDAATGEVTNVPATASDNAMVIQQGNVGVIGGMRFKVKAVVNRPVLAIDSLLDVWTFVKPERPMYEGKEVKVQRKATEGGGSFESKATLLDVIELGSNNPAVIVCGSVLKSTLNEKFPDGSYVGKFLGIKFRRVAGKNYKQVDMVELEPEAAEG
jgi:hypothetical protein